MSNRGSKENLVNKFRACSENKPSYLNQFLMKTAVKFCDHEPINLVKITSSLSESSRSDAACVDFVKLCKFKAEGKILRIRSYLGDYERFWMEPLSCNPNVF